MTKYDVTYKLQGIKSSVFNWRVPDCWRNLRKHFGINRHKSGTIMELDQK